MKIGCPKEIKPQEFRVGMTPDAVREAVNHGHAVVVETNAGAGAGFADADYIAAGATMLGTAEEVFAETGLRLPVMISGTITDLSGRTLSGPAEFVRASQS